MTSKDTSSQGGGSHENFDSICCHQLLRLESKASTSKTAGMNGECSFNYFEGLKALPNSFPQFASPRKQNQPCRDHFPLQTQAAEVPFFVPLSPHSAKKQGEEQKNEFNTLST